MMSNITCAFYELLLNVPTDIYITVIITVVLNIVFAITAVGGNSLVITSILTTPELQTTSNILLLCLASSDCLVGLIAQPLFITTYINVLLPNVYCLNIDVETYRNVLYIFGGLSFLTLFLISVERYFAVLYPFKYQLYFTRKHAVFSIAAVWPVALFLPLANFFGLDIDLFYKLIVILVLGNISLTVLIYCRIFKIAWEQSKKIHNLQQGVNATAFSAREMKTARTMAIVVGSLLVCYVPAIVGMLLHILWNPDVRVRTGDLLYFPWAETIVFTNSTLNPLIYCWRNKDIRRAVLRIVSSVDFRRRVTPILVTSYTGPVTPN